MAIPVSITGTVADQRRAEMHRLLTLLFSQNVLDEEFEQIQAMEDERAPNFVADVLNSFFRDAENLSKIFHGLLAKKEKPDFDKVEVYANQMIGCSSSVGARRICNVCVAFRSAAEQANRVGCLIALEVMDHEFGYFKSKMEEFIQMKQEMLVAAGAGHPPQN